MVARFLTTSDSLGATTDLHHHTTGAARFKILKTFEVGNPSSFAIALSRITLLIKCRHQKR
jgi:hypothetical protein